MMNLNTATGNVLKIKKKCLDIILANGFRPIIEISRIPRAFSNPDNPLGFNGDMRGWSNFIKEFITFLLDTYGLEEIEKWYFEFWNEPDHQFWSGDQPVDWRGVSNMQRIDDYCRIYDWTAEAVKKTCKTLRFGGPASVGNTAFIKAFLKHCHEGFNEATKGYGAPIDFFSFHIYSNSPERFPCMENMLAKIEDISNMIPLYYGKTIPMLLTEWGITWGGGSGTDKFPVGHRNTLYSATFTLKFIKEIIRYNFDVVLFWGFSEQAWNIKDEKDFSGKRTLLNASNTERPILGAYKFLEKLNGERCRVHRLTDTNNVDALSTVDNTQVNILFWNHDSDPFNNSYPSRTEIIVENTPVRSAELKIDCWTVEHNTYAEWERLGRPEKPTKEKIGKMNKYSLPSEKFKKTIRIDNGVFSTGEIVIHPGELYLMTIKWDAMK